MAFADKKSALMTYCRLEELTVEEETLLESFYLAAVSYLAQAGIAEPESGPRAAQYDLCVNFLVLNFYDSRTAVLSGTAADNPVFRALLTQLKLTEPITAPSESDESEG